MVGSSSGPKLMFDVKFLIAYASSNGDLQRLNKIGRRKYRIKSKTPMLAKSRFLKLEFYSSHFVRHPHHTTSPPLRFVFKKKAARAVRAIKKFAQVTMKTQDVRIDSKLNKFIWSKGVRNVPYRVRVRLSRKRNDDEDAKEKLYTLVQHVQVASYKGLQNETVDE
ncbi:unnamed protein product [Phytophthora fragariaefolia]|uniref:Unnamed protein product n=1 Tax=Phytophthora fragariaefolia TaxID=1490495 RepID=A0A9W6XU54_9STRA|nr:unnamed protein product [Phytophthora fragariaefolia]